MLRLITRFLPLLAILLLIACTREPLAETTTPVPNVAVVTEEATATPSATTTPVPTATLESPTATVTLIPMATPVYCPDDTPLPGAEAGPIRVFFVEDGNLRLWDEEVDTTETLQVTGTSKSAGHLELLQLQLGGNVDAAADGAGDGAVVFVEAEDALGCFTMLGGQLEGVAYMDATDDEDAVFFFDFSCGLGYQSPFSCGNVTRLQRASKGAGQSTGGCGDDVVEGGGVRLVLGHVCPIVLCDV